jgi:hypothetical protein
MSVRCHKLKKKMPNVAWINYPYDSHVFGFVLTYQDTFNMWHVKKQGCLAPECISIIPSNNKQKKHLIHLTGQAFPGDHTVISGVKFHAIHLSPDTLTSYDLDSNYLSDRPETLFTSSPGFPSGLFEIRPP